MHASHCQLKRWAREINVVEPAPEARKPLKWSRTPIIFDEEDHPGRTTAVGCFPLLVSPTIRNLKVTKMLVDGGAGLNPISPAVISKLQIGEEELEVTGMFQGVNPGRSHPKRKITLPVTFEGELNYQTEKVVFDVVDLPLPYNGILGHQALAKFMATSHYAYNTLKMHGPLGVITIRSDEKNAIVYVDKMYRDAVAAEAAAAPTKDSKGKKMDCRTSGKESEKRAPPSAWHPLTMCQSIPTTRDPRLLHPK